MESSKTESNYPIWLHILQAMILFSFVTDRPETRGWRWYEILFPFLTWWVLIATLGVIIVTWRLLKKILHERAL